MYSLPVVCKGASTLGSSSQYEMLYCLIGDKPGNGKSCDIVPRQGTFEIIEVLVASWREVMRRAAAEPGIELAEPGSSGELPRPLISRFPGLVT